VAPAVLEHPRARTSVPKAERLQRIALKEAIDRFNNELMSDAERQLVLDRIKRLRQGKA
jgi:hypothetical protein